MTPTFLSKLFMKAILPAQFSLGQKHPILKDDIPKSWFARTYNANSGAANQPENNSAFKEFEIFYKKLDYSHVFTPLSVDGLETLECKQKNFDKVEKYKILFAGNGEDGLCFIKIYRHIHAYPDTNYIFWNYPGVGASTGVVQSPDDLYIAGYQQVKRLLNQGVSADAITLSAFSLGGAVATRVARQLHEEGHLVHLQIDRSFGLLSSVVPAMIKQALIAPDTSKPKRYAPLISSTIAFAVSGLALGTTLAGLIASASQITALCRINKISSTLASWIDNAAYWAGSFLGGVIGIAGFFVGSVVGLVVGAMLSIQLFWTDTPILMPMLPIFSALFYSVCCEMDSVGEMNRLFKADNQPENYKKSRPDISVCNVMNDRVIPVEASLNVALGCKPRDNWRLEHINSVWFKKGGHTGPVKELVTPLSVC